MQSGAEHPEYPIEYCERDVRADLTEAAAGRSGKACGLRRILLTAVIMLMLAAASAGCGGKSGSGLSGGDPTENAESAENAENAEGAEDAESAESAENAEDAESVESEKGEKITEITEEVSDPAVPTTALAPSGGGYKAPEFFSSEFHKDKAVGSNGILIDLSSVSKGYFGVSATSANRLKCQVIKDGSTYTYDLRSDGTPSIFPLQMEDGMYSFRVLENVSGTKYAVLYTTDQTVSIEDEYSPYLCSSDYVRYTESSSCVKKAKELAGNASDVNGVISEVYKYVCATVKYDKEKAQTVQSGYLPNPDETMSTGKGICFDYASLAGAMLRSQGIPCKVVFGYVSPNEVYHAWNMFYTKENGWVTASFEISGKKWNRMDLTFSANGADGKFVGDGSNYKDVYYY